MSSSGPAPSSRSPAGRPAPDEDGKLVGEGDPAAQPGQVFENLHRCLRIEAYAVLPE